MEWLSIFASIALVVVSPFLAWIAYRAILALSEFKK